jgi:hypothetical protein
MLSDTPGTPGRRQQAPRTIRSIFTPALRGLVQRADHLGSLSAFILAMMRPGLPARACCGLALDLLEQALVQGEGRLQQALQLDRRRQPGQLLEQQVHVVADVGVGGDQADVGVGRAVPAW